MCGSDGAVFGEKKERGEERDFQGKGERDSRVKVVAGWKGRGGEKARERKVCREEEEKQNVEKEKQFLFLVII